MFDEFQRGGQDDLRDRRARGALIRNPDPARAQGPGPGGARSQADQVRQHLRRFRAHVAGGQVHQEQRRRPLRRGRAASSWSRPSGPWPTRNHLHRRRTWATAREGITARLIVPRRFAHVAYARPKLFKPAATDNPTYQVVMFFDEGYEANKAKPLPEKDITIRLAHAPDGRLVKFVRNSNYFGEWKKGVFAGEDYRAKLHGDAIFLHAGCRKDTLENRHGAYVTSYSLFVALSANGKTSTTCRVLARKGRERSWLIQDDGGTLLRDGRFRGFEAGGLFVKTDCLNPGDQSEAYYACLRKDTFLENVAVTEDGSIDFYDLSRTSNGRAVVERRDFMHTANDINARRIDNLFLITRGNIIPAVAKLTHEQAAAFMVLGQSMESSAGDPTQAGTIKNEFFYDPFIAGDRSEHANLFYDILQAMPRINCYLLNTGGVGEGRFLQGHHAWPTRWASSIRSSAAGRRSGSLRRRRG